MEHTDLDSLRERLKRFKEERGLTQIALARRLRVSQPLISKVLTGSATHLSASSRAKMERRLIDGHWIVTLLTGAGTAASVYTAIESAVRNRHDCSLSDLMARSFKDVVAAQRKALAHYTEDVQRAGVRADDAALAQAVDSAGDLLDHATAGDFPGRLRAVAPAFRNALILPGFPGTQSDFDAVVARLLRDAFTELWDRLPKTPAALREALLPAHVGHFERSEEVAQEVREVHAAIKRMEETLETLTEAPPAPPPFSNVPHLPGHYLRRPECIDAAKRALLQEAAPPVGVIGTSHGIAVQGMGGIGKSVLAAAVAHDAEVQDAFPNGIIWLTLGQEPPITTRQLDVAVACGENPGAFPDAQHGKVQLGRLLADRACLLILDDVWDARHVHWFDAFGPRSRMIITTRDAGIVASVGAERIELDLLTDEQALALLADWSGRDVADLPDVAHEVVRECGNLPLALAMIGAMVEGRPETWDRALYRLQHADLDKIRRDFPGYPYPDLLRALEVSVDALSEDERERYLDLAVFPEDTPIPVATLATLWAPQGLNQYDVQELIDLFVQRSLARHTEADRGGVVAREDRRTSLRTPPGRGGAAASAPAADAPRHDHLLLHDLQHDYVRTRAEPAENLNARLVEAYRKRCTDGWPTGPNDGYFFQYLPEHLAAAEYADELGSLLLDFDWLRATLDATDPNVLLSHFDLLAEDDHRLIQSAIRLSAHVLARDKAQFPGQLLGRLLSHEHPGIRRLLSQLPAATDPPWFRPLTPALTQAGGPLLRTLEGHAGPVLAVAVTRDGRRAISGSGDNTVRVWDLESGEQLRALHGHTDPVWAIAVTPGGRRAISGSGDNTVRVWDLESGEQLRALEGHGGSVAAVAVTPEGRRAISGSGDNTVRVWDLESGEQLRILQGHTDAVLAVAVTSDGRRAISGSGDNTVRVWDLESGEQLRALEGHTDRVRAVAVTPDGRRAISGSGDNTVRVWDLASGEQLRTLQGHASDVTAVAVSPDGRRAISASEDNTVRIWDLESGEQLRALEGHADSVSAVAVTPHRGRAISGSWDNTVRVWDLESREQLRPLQGHADSVYAVAVTPDGRRAISGSWDKALRIWDLESGEQLRALEGHTDSVNAVAVTPDGRRVICGSYDRTVRIWDLESGEQLRALEGHADSVSAVAVTPHRGRAISGSWDNTVRLWDLQSSEQLRALEAHAGPVSAVAVTADGHRAISACGDSTVDVWDLESGEQLCALEGHAGSVEALAVTPDGRRAISGSDDNTVRVWDLESGELLCTFTADAAVLACAVGPHGRTIVAGDEAGRVHFLRLEGV